MNSTSEANLPPPNLSIGAIEVAEKFVTFLFGIGTIQTFIFFKTNKYVYYWNKVAVFLVWLFSALHVLTIHHLTYHYLVTTKGNLDGPMVASYTANVVAQLLLSNLTQLLYFLRLSRIFPRHNKYRIPIFCVLAILIFFSTVANMVILVGISRFQTLSTLLHRPEHSTKREAAFEAVVLFGFCDTSAIDFCLTLALFYALRRSGRMFGWTDSNFMALASYMINTGFLASFFSVSCIITYLLMKYNLVYQALRNFSTEFYAVSFLAMVNAPYYFDTLHEERTRSLYIERDTSHTRSTSFHSGSHQTTSATQDFEMNTPTRKTINEVGLPLFNRSSSSPPHTIQPIQQSVLEVNMIREQRRAIESIYTSRH